MLSRHFDLYIARQLLRVAFVLLFKWPLNGLFTIHPGLRLFYDLLLFMAISANQQ